MRGQASRGVWQPVRAPPPARPPGLSRGEGPGGGGGGVGNGRTGIGITARGKKNKKGDGSFILAADHAAAAAVAGDALSDSESEDEGDDAPMPTPADARTVFDDTAATAGVAGEGGGKEGLGGAASGGIDETATTGPGDGRGGGGVGGGAQPGGDSLGEGRGRAALFARDGALAALEDMRRKKRVEDAERLADRMSVIGAEVRGALRL